MEDEEPDTGPRLPGRWWMPQGWGLPDTLGDVRHRNVIVVLAVALTIYFHLDVGPRARIVAGRPEVHRTDFTVYTEAGAAFFDGREPYEVKNVRGWTYIYPPLLALMVAPLSVLDSESQVLVWFILSATLCFGCYGEASRLWQFLVSSDQDSPRRDPLSFWLGACVGMTVLLPTLACLQRGQVGIALLYALLLGYRLVVIGERWMSRFLGGVVLAWAVVLKLVPALPVGFMLWQHWLLALSPGRGRRDFVRASVFSLSVTAGVFLFLLAIPGAAVGWNTNLRHLQTWSRKVVMSDDPGFSYKAYLDSTNNQSLTNAVHLLVARLRAERPDDVKSVLVRFARTPVERQMAEDKATALMRQADHTTQGFIRIAKGLLLALLFGLALVPARNDLTGHSVAFGLACLGILLVSPVAWTHYYMMTLPAILCVPLWLDRKGHPKTARWMAGAPLLLIWTHFLAKYWVGPIGLLGLGTTVWFLAVCALVIRERVRDLRRDSLVNASSSIDPHQRRVDNPHDVSRTEERTHCGRSGVPALIAEYRGDERLTD
jgi:Glycosyltransferase family 87